MNDTIGPTAEEAVDWRRIYLRGWRCVSADGCPSTRIVNVEIWVRYENSSSSGDELTDVLDYNIMRDALMTAGAPDSDAFLTHALDEIMKSPVELAHVEIYDELTGKTFHESRRAKS
ncbi:hypothetical protein [Burkholderia sp. Ac-20353]|uniref:hypothetical protein n=1 Tax=Burkholderia sp. Ac-20353 TaxID=2703894 RepID=UPI00197BA9F1|nr:hypothetical protein [Burkholderia sp. Ac-20353]MBN3786522.1 hypothetical protein [Burkholderia sp. Ac-20353]